MDEISRGSSSIQENEEAKKHKLLILCAGKTRAGKSTALNNIFGTDFPAKYASSSVSKTVGVRRLAKGNDELIVVDTPGLGAKDINTDRAIDMIKSHVGDLDYTLVYCFSVSSDSVIDEADQRVIHILQKALKKTIWGKCVILLTHCDEVRSKVYPKVENREEYKSILREHVESESALLKRTCGWQVGPIKPVFDLTEEDNIEKIIVAIPVGEKQRIGKEKHNLIPGLEEGGDWKKQAFDQIVQKTSPLLRRSLSLAVEGKESALAGAGAGTVCAALGATVGGLVGGLTSAGLGAGPGVAIGLFTGAVVDGALGSTSRLGTAKYKNEKINKKIDKLERAEFLGSVELPTPAGMLHTSGRPPVEHLVAEESPPEHSET